MELSVYAYPHIFLYDGRGADKPWLQELPEPVTQIVWDSWAEIHPETARKLGVAKDDVIEIKTEHGAIEAPVLVESTVRPGVIAVPIRTGTSRVRPLCERRRRKCVGDTGERRDLRRGDRARDRQDSHAGYAARQQRHDGPIDRRGDEYRAARGRRSFRRAKRKKSRARPKCIRRGNTRDTNGA